MRRKRRRRTQSISQAALNEGTIATEDAERLRREFLARMYGNAEQDAEEAQYEAERAQLRRNFPDWRP